MTTHQIIPVCVLTATRKTETIYKTISSLKNGGFDDFYIYHDRNNQGIWPGYITLAKRSLEIFGLSRPLLLVEDDIVVCRDLHDYLLMNLQWVMESHNGLFSLYLNESTRQKLFWGFQDGIHETKEVDHVCGALAWLWNPRTLSQMIASTDINRDDPMGTDIYALQWLHTKRYKIYHHLPSLVQHEDQGCSTYSNKQELIYRRSDTFPGEDFSCHNLDFSNI